MGRRRKSSWLDDVYARAATTLGENASESDLVNEMIGVIQKDQAKPDLSLPRPDLSEDLTFENVVRELVRLLPKISAAEKLTIRRGLLAVALRTINVSTNFLRKLIKEKQVLNVDEVKLQVEDLIEIKNFFVNKIMCEEGFTEILQYAKEANSREDQHRKKLYPVHREKHVLRVNEWVAFLNDLKKKHEHPPTWPLESSLGKQDADVPCHARSDDSFEPSHATSPTASSPGATAISLQEPLQATPTSGFASTVHGDAACDISRTQNSSIVERTDVEAYVSHAELREVVNAIEPWCKVLKQCEDFVDRLLLSNTKLDERKNPLQNNFVSDGGARASLGDGVIKMLRADFARKLRTASESFSILSDVFRSVAERIESVPSKGNPTPLFASDTLETDSCDRESDVLDKIEEFPCSESHGAELNSSGRGDLLVRQAWKTYDVSRKRRHSELTEAESRLESLNAKKGYYDGELGKIIYSRSFLGRQRFSEGDTELDEEGTPRRSKSDDDLDYILSEDVQERSVVLTDSCVRSYLNDSEDVTASEGSYELGSTTSELQNVETSVSSSEMRECSTRWREDSGVPSSCEESLEHTPRSEIPSVGQAGPEFRNSYVSDVNEDPERAEVHGEMSEPPKSPNAEVVLDAEALSRSSHALVNGVEDVKSPSEKQSREFDAPSPPERAGEGGRGAAQPLSRVRISDLRRVRRRGVSNGVGITSQKEDESIPSVVSSLETDRLVTGHPEGSGPCISYSLRSIREFNAASSWLWNFRRLTVEGHSGDNEGVEVASDSGMVASIFRRLVGLSSGEFPLVPGVALLLSFLSDDQLEFAGEVDESGAMKESGLVVLCLATGAKLNHAIWSRSSWTNLVKLLGEEATYFVCSVVAAAGYVCRRTFIWPTRDGGKPAPLDHLTADLTSFLENRANAALHMGRKEIGETTKLWHFFMSATRRQSTEAMEAATVKAGTAMARLICEYRTWRFRKVRRLGSGRRICRELVLPYDVADDVRCCEQFKQLFAWASGKRLERETRPNCVSISSKRISKNVEEPETSDAESASSQDNSCSYEEASDSPEDESDSEDSDATSSNLNDQGNLFALGDGDEGEANAENNDVDDEVCVVFEGPPAPVAGFDSISRRLWTSRERGAKACTRADFGKVRAEISAFALQLSRTPAAELPLLPGVALLLSFVFDPLLKWMEVRSIGVRRVVIPCSLCVIAAAQLNRTEWTEASWDELAGVIGEAATYFVCYIVAVGGFCGRQQFIWPTRDGGMPAPLDPVTPKVEEFLEKRAEELLGLDVARVTKARHGWRFAMSATRRQEGPAAVEAANIASRTMYRVVKAYRSWLSVCRGGTGTVWSYDGSLLELPAGVANVMDSSKFRAIFSKSSGTLSLPDKASGGTQIAGDGQRSNPRESAEIEILASTPKEASADAVSNSQTRPCEVRLKRLQLPVSLQEPSCMTSESEPSDAPRSKTEKSDESASGETGDSHREAVIVENQLSSSTQMLVPGRECGPFVDNEDGVPSGSEKVPPGGSSVVPESSVAPSTSPPLARPNDANDNNISESVCSIPVPSEVKANFLGGGSEGIQRPGVAPKKSIGLSILRVESLAVQPESGSIAGNSKRVKVGDEFRAAPKNPEAPTPVTATGKSKADEAGDTPAAFHLLVDSLIKALPARRDVQPGSSSDDVRFLGSKYPPLEDFNAASWRLWTLRSRAVAAKTKEESRVVAKDVGNVGRQLARIPAGKFPLVPGVALLLGFLTDPQLELTKGAENRCLFLSSLCLTVAGKLNHAEWSLRHWTELGNVLGREATYFVCSIVAAAGFACRGLYVWPTRDGGMPAPLECLTPEVDRFLLGAGAVGLGMDSAAVASARDWWRFFMRATRRVSAEDMVVSARSATVESYHIIVAYRKWILARLRALENGERLFWDRECFPLRLSEDPLAVLRVEEDPAFATIFDWAAGKIPRMKQDVMTLEADSSTRRERDSRETEDWEPGKVGLIEGNRANDESKEVQGPRNSEVMPDHPPGSRTSSEGSVAGDANERQAELARRSTLSTCQVPGGRLGTEIVPALVPPVPFVVVPRSSLNLVVPKSESGGQRVPVYRTKHPVLPECPDKKPLSLEHAGPRHVRRSAASSSASIGIIRAGNSKPAVEEFRAKQLKLDAKSGQSIRASSSSGEGVGSIPIVPSTPTAEISRSAAARQISVRPQVKGPTAPTEAPSTPTAEIPQSATARQISVRPQVKGPTAPTEAPSTPTAEIPQSATARQISVGAQLKGPTVPTEAPSTSTVEIPQSATARQISVRPQVQGPTAPTECFPFVVRHGSIEVAIPAGGGGSRALGGLTCPQLTGPDLVPVRFCVNQPVAHPVTPVTSHERLSHAAVACPTSIHAFEAPPVGVQQGSKPLPSGIVSFFPSAEPHVEKANFSHAAAVPEHTLMVVTRAPYERIPRQIPAAQNHSPVQQGLLQRGSVASPFQSSSASSVGSVTQTTFQYVPVSCSTVQAHVTAPLVAPSSSIVAGHPPLVTTQPADVAAFSEGVNSLVAGVGNSDCNYAGRTDLVTDCSRVTEESDVMNMDVVCVVCGQAAVFECPCGEAVYCSQSCQTCHWEVGNHMSSCKAVSE